MKAFVRGAGLLCLASMLGFAGNVSGWLVGSHCYASSESNRSDIPSWVNWDRNLAIRYCSPNRRTKSFALVRQDGTSLKFDPAGNERALELGLSAHKKIAYMVNVTGNVSRNTIQVRTISISRRVRRDRHGAPGL